MPELPTRLDITPEMARAIRRYEIACARFTAGHDSTDAVSLPLLAIGAAAAAALGLPALRDLFRGVVVPRYRPRPAKVTEAYRRSRRVADAG